MLKHGALIIIFFISLLALSACDKTPKGEQVATVNGEPITTMEYQGILAARFGTKVARNESERVQAIDWMVKRKLLIQEAQKQKLDERKEVALAIRLSREELLIRALTAKYLKDNPVSEEDTKKRYDELRKEKEYKISHILLPTAEQAKQFIIDLGKGKSFKSIAKKNSLDVDSAKRGGTINGWVNQYGIAPEIYFAAAKLKKGAIGAAPVKSNYGWHIVRRDGSRYMRLPPFSKYKQKMMERVHRERIDTLINHLRSKADIVVLKNQAGATGP